MSTVRNLFKTADSPDGYFENLPKGTQKIVKDLILEAANDRNGPEGWKPDDDAIEPIECHSRDGFIAFDHNRGGFVYRNFSCLLDYWGGGYSVAHKGANAEIERQIAYCTDGIDMQADDAIEKSGLDDAHDSSIMHEIRFMYHGREDGTHSASVSAAVNTEGPYHRSSISWAPNVFCEGSKEVEITWTNQAELKRKLAKALKQVSKAVF